MKYSKEDIKEKIQFKDVQDNQTILDLANLLLKGKTLCVNFTNCDPQVAQEMLDFLSGVCYATDGLIKTMKSNIFLFGTKDNLRDPVIKDFIKNYS